MFGLIRKAYYGIKFFLWNVLMHVILTKFQKRSITKPIKTKLELVDFGYHYPQLSDVPLRIPKQVPKDERSMIVDVILFISRQMQIHLCLNEDYEHHAVKSLKEVYSWGFTGEAPAFPVSPTDNILESIIRKGPFTYLYSDNRIDLSDLANFPIQDGYYHLGATAQFDTNDRLMFIEYRGKKYSQSHRKYKLIENIMIASITFYNALVYHMLYLHLQFSQTASQIVINTLPHTHPLRLLLHRHIFQNTENTLRNLRLLIQDDMAAASQLWKYDMSTIEAILRFYASKYRFSINKEPEIYDIISTFVQNVTRHSEYNDDDTRHFLLSVREAIPGIGITLSEIVTNIIYVETVEHHKSGTLIYPYYANLDKFPCHVKKNGNVPNHTHMSRMLVLLSAVNLPVSGIADVNEEFIPRKYHEYLFKFHHDLEKHENHLIRLYGKNDPNLVYPSKVQLSTAT